MSSILSCRYWTCPSCCRQFDWETDYNAITMHDVEKCQAKRYAPSTKLKTSVKKKKQKGI